jgi:hypothetical protein
VSLLLADLVGDFARGIQAVDSLAPAAAGARYRPGIGPHNEAQTVKLVMAYLAKIAPQRYGSYQLGVPYADGTRQTCDMCLGEPEPWEWAIEIKMLRLMGDNGKLNDNLLMHILSPYPAHRSAVTDCAKLIRAALGVKKAILVYGYDYPDWPMEPALEAFEALANRQVRLSDRAAASFGGLVHPVHQQGRVCGWEIRPR